MNNPQWCCRVVLVIGVCGILMLGGACHPRPKPVNLDDAHIQLYLSPEFIETVGYDVSKDDK
jgi:hypothetical protein